MQRTYTYEWHFYRNKVLFMTYALIAILLYSLYQIAVNGINPLWLIISAPCCYGIKNTFLTKSVPRQIIVDDETITFKSYGQKTIRIDSLQLFRVKSSTPNYQIFVRAADGEGNKGNFWITYNYFNDKQDLLEELNFLERKAHPDSLRLRGRDQIGVRRPHEKIHTERE